MSIFAGDLVTFNNPNNGMLLKVWREWPVKGASIDVIALLTSVETGVVLTTAPAGYPVDTAGACVLWSSGVIGWVPQRFIRRSDV